MSQHIVVWGKRPSQLACLYWIGSPPLTPMPARPTEWGLRIGVQLTKLACVGQPWPVGGYWAVGSIGAAGGLEMALVGVSN